MCIGPVIETKNTIIFLFKNHLYLNITIKFLQIYFISQIVSKWGGGESNFSHILHSIFQSTTA